MSAASQPFQSQLEAQRRATAIRVSAYDRFSGLLISLLVLVGLAVLLLFLIWMTSQFTYHPRPVPVVPIDDLMGRGEAAEGIERDLEPPGVEEFADVPEPQLSDTLAAVTDAVSSQLATLDAMEGNAMEMGSGTGKGDSRAAGPGGEGNADIVPPWERWELQFSTKNIKEYADQLDFFEVELGAVHGSPDITEVYYARNLSAASPTARTGDRADDKRLYFAPTKSQGTLNQWGHSLVQKAGFNTNGRFVLQFYSDRLNAELIQKERAALSGGSLESVYKTIFAVRPGGAGYEIYVVEQRLGRR